jgi:hypothetical protein
MKELSSRKLQVEFLVLNRKYYGHHFCAIGFGSRSTSNNNSELAMNIWNSPETQVIRMIIILYLKSNRKLTLEDFQPAKLTL